MARRHQSRRRPGLPPPCPGRAPRRPPAPPAWAGHVVAARRPRHTRPGPARSVHAGRSRRAARRGLSAPRIAPGPSKGSRQGNAATAHRRDRTSRRRCLGTASIRPRRILPSTVPHAMGSAARRSRASALAPTSRRCCAGRPPHGRPRHGTPRHAAGGHVGHVPRGRRTHGPPGARPRHTPVPAGWSRPPPRSARPPDQPLSTPSCKAAPALTTACAPPAGAAPRDDRHPAGRDRPAPGRVRPGCAARLHDPSPAA